MKQHQYYVTVQHVADAQGHPSTYDENIEFNVGNHDDIFQIVERLKADQGKLQNPATVKAIVRQNLDPYVDGQAFTRIVMGTYANSSTPAQRAQFEQNFRNTLIENYGSAFAKYSNQSYSMRPYKATISKIETKKFPFKPSHDNPEVPRKNSNMTCHNK